MIKELTEAQKAQLPVERDRWIKVGTSTETNREEAEKAVDLSYERAGLTPPKQKFWARSPYEGVVFAVKLENSGRIDGDYTPSFSEIESQLGNACYGLHDSYWVAFYNFMEKECNIPLPQIDGIRQTCLHCGWWWPFDEAVVISEKPTEIHFDDRNRLHNESGAALRYSDGWGIWSWHGTRVPRRLIEDPDSYTAEDILREENVEVRRCMFEKIGFNKFVEKATQLHSDGFGTLYSLNIPRAGEVRFVRVQNKSAEPDGTYKFYCLTVPATMSTAHQAVAWTFGKTPETYNPDIET